jgi:hypothetical protein
VSRTLYFDGMKNTASGSTNPGAACPSTASGWTHSALVSGSVANSAGLPLFRYDSATTSAIRAVALDLRLDAGTTAAPKTIALRSAAYMRTFSGGAPALGVSDLTVTCNGPTALLSLATSFDSSGNPLTATYTTSGGIPLGSGSVSLATNVQGDIKVTITNVLGLQEVLTKTVSC